MADSPVVPVNGLMVEHISDHAQRAKIGQIEDAAQTAEYHDVLHRRPI